MYYIHSIYSINHQKVFYENKIHLNLKVINETDKLQEIDYKNHINPNKLRRLSPILRISLVAAKSCASKINSPIDGIIVGTGLGCLTDTEKFLDNIYNTKDEMLSPTAFIQSTHNTIAGQISLELNNHSYNMTHTQNDISFEMALIDGILCCNEDENSFIMVGCADEKIDFLNKIKINTHKLNIPITTSCTFFTISKINDVQNIAIIDCSIINQQNDIIQSIEEFLNNQKISFSDLSAIYSCGKKINNDRLKTICINEYAGYNHSVSGFVLHVAHDYLKDNKGKYILIINISCSGSIGLILMANVEA